MEIAKSRLTTKEVTGIILAGGRSSRMGKNKAFLQVKREEKIIDFVVEIFQQLFQEAIIVSNEPELYNYLDVTVIPDILPRKGPLSGIHAGLVTSKTEYVFVVPCDMPFLNINIIKLLVSEASGFDVVVPQFNNYLEPLHAIYNKKCITHIEKSLADDIHKVYAFYPWVKVNFVGENKLLSASAGAELEKIFYNINTPVELERAKKF